MKIFIKRWLVYLLIPAGLVLLFVPLPTYRLGGVDKDFVFLEISETFTTEESSKDNAFSFSNATPERVLQQIQEQQRRMEQEISNATTVSNSYGYPTIQEQDLTPYSALKKEVNHTMQLRRLWRVGRIGARRLDDVPLEEWAAFKKAHLGRSDGAFVYGNSVFLGHIESGYASIDIEVKNLKIGCKMVGGVMLLLSLFALYGMYATSSGGIQIGTKRGMIIWDTITMGVGLVFMWWFLDFILMKYFQTSSEWNDEFTTAMSVFWVAFANPVVALIATAMSLQSVLIARDGIAVKGLFGRNGIVWSDVEGLEIAEIFAPRKVGGMLAARKVSKVLEIRGASNVLRIMEPPMSSTKKEIISSLAEHAPEELRERISNLSKEWLSVW